MDPLDDPDARLMAEVAGGDLAAFERLVIRNQKSAWSLAYRFLGNAADAEDAAQEAFLRILRAAPGYRPKAKFRTFLLSVTGNICRDMLSKKRPLVLEETGDLRDLAPDPGEVLEGRERTGGLRRALGALPAKQRLALLLRHYEELSYEEIAGALHTSTKAVDSLLQRARRTLQELLAETG
ncbi:MAG: sigma-70 family RNA polymerase sigma factor [Acidobacteria bacterium]|nr:sigma-70 family RNA polymerase sigma factor [Acidobacteriota bacterium]